MTEKQADPKELLFVVLLSPAMVFAVLALRTAAIFWAWSTLTRIVALPEPTVQYAMAVAIAAAIARGTNHDHNDPLKNQPLKQLGRWIGDMFGSAFMYAVLNFALMIVCY